MNMGIGRSVKPLRLSGISLKWRLIFSILAVTLLVLSINSYYSYKQTAEIQRKRTQETSLAQFRQMETNLRSLLGEVNKLSNSFLFEKTGTENGGVQDFLESDPLPNAAFVPLQTGITDVVTQYLSNYDYLDSIYIFKDNGMVIGGTLRQNQSTALMGLAYPFYRTALYEAAKDHYPDVIWEGGLKSDYFMRKLPGNNAADNDVISMVKGVKPIGFNQRNAVLAVNINEEYIHSIYRDLASLPDGSISIVGSGGKVISSTIRDSIGEGYALNGKLMDGSRYGSFSAHRGGVEEQVIFYRMGNPDWVLVSEVPIALYMKDVENIQRFTIVLFVLSVVLIVIISSVWVNRIMKSFQQLIKGMRQVGRGNIGTRLPASSNREIGLMIEQFNSMSQGILDLMRKNEEAEKEKRRLEIEALQLQINPHFLFNTLNTVKWMAAVAGAPNIMNCMTTLGNLLRPVYNQPSLMWSLREEIEFVRNYVNIMNYRFGDGIVFELDVPDRYMDCQTLRFIVQPLVENAFAHGEMTDGVIRVAVAEAKGELALSVSDTGSGMPGEKAEEVNRNLRRPDDGEAQDGLGIGLFNVHKRIRLHFGERYGLAVASEEGKGTTVTMSMPMLYAPPPHSVQKE